MDCFWSEINVIEMLTSTVASVFPSDIFILLLSYCMTKCFSNSTVLFEITIGCNCCKPIITTLKGCACLVGWPELKIEQSYYRSDMPYASDLVYFLSYSSVKQIVSTNWTVGVARGGQEARPPPNLIGWNGCQVNPESSSIGCSTEPGQPQWDTSFWHGCYNDEHDRTLEWWTLSLALVGVVEKPSPAWRAMM